MIPQGLRAMASFPQWIVWKLVQATPKNRKIPVHAETLQAIDPHDPNQWMTAENAYAWAAHLGDAYHVGFVFTESDPLFFIDIDGCKNLDGSWSDFALSVVNRFPGAAVEVSTSGNGLHVFGISGPVGEHRKNRRDLGLEFYTELRFVALGDPASVVGDSGTDHTQALMNFTAEVMPPTAHIEGTIEGWTEEPSADWCGPEDDIELLELAMRSKSIAAGFGDKASFADLWSANEEKLGRTYPDLEKGRSYNPSEADAALMAHLAFWTGRDCERMERLFRMSALWRSKWEERIDFFRSNEVQGAAGRCQKVYSNSRYEPILESVQALPADMTGGIDGSTFKVGYQFKAVDQQLEHFKGCVYIAQQHKIFTPKGLFLTQDRFNAMYGGYVFALDAVGRVTSKNAFEVFTQSQGLQFPKADAICFRPELPPGGLFDEEGLVLLNTYIPFPIAKTEGDASPFLDLIAKMIPDDRDRAVLLSYICAVVQYPGVKFQWCPLLQGVVGNGKTLVISAIEHAVGRRYTHIPNAEQLMARNPSQFNAWQQGKIFIAVEEVFMRNRTEAFERMKDKITNKRLEFEGKGADQVMGDNRANWFMGSNHKDGVVKTADDRRIAPIYCAQQYKSDLERDGLNGPYFNRLYKWFDNGGKEIIGHYLSTAVIPAQYNPATECQRAPETSGTAEAIMLSEGPVEQKIRETIEEGRPGFRNGWVSSMQLELLLEKLRKDVAVPTAKRRGLMLSLGYIIHPGLPNGRVNSDTKLDMGRPRLYVREGHVNASITDTQMISAKYQQDQLVGGVEQTGSATVHAWPT